MKHKSVVKLSKAGGANPDVTYLGEIWCKNELFGRALQIIQDEEYLDDVDFDEIKRRKRQSPFTKNQSEDKTMEVFKEGLNRNEMKPKIQIHREKRQLTVDTILNSHNDLDLRYALPKEKKGYYQSAFKSLIIHLFNILPLSIKLVEISNSIQISTGFGDYKKKGKVLTTIYLFRYFFWFQWWWHSWWQWQRL